VARSNEDRRQNLGQGSERDELSGQVEELQEELAAARRRLTETPRHMHILEERLAAAQSQIDRLSEQNERLVSTLKEAR
jgi:proteasome-associated ATPase